MRSFFLARSIAISFALVLLLSNQLLASEPSSDDKELRRCWRQRYKTEVAMPGVNHEKCKTTVTLTKCEGYCVSKSGPVLSGFGVRWDSDCKCCQPKKYRDVVVAFPECGSTLTIRDIRSCHCKPC